MSDEEDETLSEAFSASEDEWKPGKHAHDDGESSDDDDSDFDDATGTAVGGATAKAQGPSRKREPKSHSKGKVDGGGVSKKRKPMGQSLRSRLYNKYRPPPKTCPTSSNSPTASTSRTASKNELTPNEVSGYGDDDDDGSSSDCSVANHLVNPAELDLKSSFFDVENKGKASNAPPEFDCNAGIENMTDSESEHSNAMSGDDNNKPSDAFDFRHLLEKANSLERAKEQIAKRRKETANTKTSKSKDTTVDVTSLLALGENQNRRKKIKNQDKGAEEDDDDDDDDEEDDDARTPSTLSKTKSTRIKRHTKTRPTSTIVTGSAGGGGGAGGDTDDSDWEEVAGRKRK